MVRAVPSVSSNFAIAALSVSLAAAAPPSGSLRGSAREQPASAPTNATEKSLDVVFISDGDVLRFWNDRFGSKACLDHGPNKNHVGAYPCDDHGGNSWTIECTGDMVNEYGCTEMRLTNYRFGEKVCLDHHAPNEVDAFPCTGHGGDVWSFEVTGDGNAEYDGKLRLFNSRFGEKDCLDHHAQDGTVGAYPCDNNGGDDWFYASYKSDKVDQKLLLRQAAPEDPCMLPILLGAEC